VAAAVGISVQTIREIETGRILNAAFFTFVAFADVLGLSLNDLSIGFEPQGLLTRQVRTETWEIYKRGDMAPARIPGHAWPRAVRAARRFRRPAVGVGSKAS
jgi:DNA-binding XRE family transcriptional regulator